MNNDMAFELYRVKGRNVNREQYFEILSETLEEYPFANCEQLYFAMKADKRYVKKLLLLYILDFAKKNPGLTGAQICKKLKVRSEFVAELITSGDLVVTIGDIDEIIEEQEIAQVQNEEKIAEPEERNDNLLVRELQQSIKTESGPKLELKPKGPTYHTKMHRSPDGKYIKR